MKKVIFILFLFLTSCSFKSLVIPNLPYILSNRVDSSLHLYNDQENQVKSDFKRLFEEEKTRVVQIKTYLNQIDLKNIDIKDGYGFFSKNYYAIAVKVNRILAKQFSKLDTHQIEKLQNSILEQNEEILNNIKKKTASDYYERYEYFFGELTQKQKLLINSYIVVFNELSRNRLEKRKMMQVELLNILSLTNSKEKEFKIISLFDKDADRSVISPSRAQSLDQFKEFSKTLNPKQEEFFKQKIVFFNDWIDEYLKNY